MSVNDLNMLYEHNVGMQKNGLEWCSFIGKARQIKEKVQYGLITKQFAIEEIMNLEEYERYNEVRSVKTLIRNITEMESNQIEVQNYEENLNTVQQLQDDQNVESVGDERHEIGDGGSSGNPMPLMKRKRCSKNK